MIYGQDSSQKTKLSSEFASRLRHLSPDQTIRVVVLLRVQDAARLTGKRQTAAERQAAIETMRQSAAQALQDIDSIVQNSGGRRLTDSPDLLGSIALETNADGIQHLAQSDWVQAILEDQKVSSLI